MDGNPPGTYFDGGKHAKGMEEARETQGDSVMAGFTRLHPLMAWGAPDHCPEPGFHIGRYIQIIYN